MTPFDWPPTPASSARQTSHHAARQTRNLVQLHASKLAEVFCRGRLSLTCAGNFNRLCARAKRTAPVFEKKRQSLRRLTTRLRFAAQTAVCSCLAPGQRVRQTLPEPFKDFFEDRKIVNARRKNTPHAEKDFVTIGCVEYWQRRGHGYDFRGSYREAVGPQLAAE